MKDDYPPRIYKEFGTIIVDECYHPDHELFVQNKGWVSIANVTTDDKVLGFDQSTGTSNFEPVERTISKFFSGNLVELSGEKFSIIVTPDHEQPVQKQRKSSKSWYTTRSKVKDFSVKSRIKLPIASYSPQSFGLSDVERLKIAFEADGHYLRTNKKDGMFVYRFGFRRKRKIERLVSILRSLSIEFSLKKNARGDTNIVFKYKEKLPKDFEWFDASESSCRNEQFLEEIVLWDGWKNEGGCFWEGKNEVSADKVQLIAHLCGRSASNNYYDGHGWRVRWFNEKIWMRSNGCKKIDYQYAGNVYCVTVPSGNLVTRLGKVISISGNCHRTAAPMFAKAIPKFNARIRIGLSATPKRKDGTENVFFYQIGPIVAVANTENLSATVKRVFSTDIKVLSSGMSLQRLLNYVVKHQGRNTLIANQIVSAVKADRKIIVMSHRLNQLDLLEQLIKALLAIDGSQMKYSIGKYIGGMSESALKNSAAKDIILATWTMAKEGLDIPALDTLVMATPMGDVLQGVGRILRMDDDKKRPIVVDIVDRNVPIFMNMYHARMRLYEQKGWMP
jgi:hypothetical protein